MKASVLLFVLVTSVIDVPTPLVPQNGSSTVSSKDKTIGWKADWSMETVEIRGKRAVRFTEKGAGRLSDYSGEVRWSIRSTWLADRTFAPIDTEKTITGADGTVLLVERKRFDHEKGTVEFERRKAGRSPEMDSLDIPADTLAVEGLAGVLRFATLDKSRPVSAHVLTNEPKVYKVTFEWRGEERIKTPAGEFNCYKVEMVPHLGLLSLFRPFLPKAYFWFTVAPPHDWVRYQGPENGPGTPDVVMELSSTGH